MKVNWKLIEFDQKHQILYIQDLNQGGKTITNAAEEVLTDAQYLYGPKVRVVYLDTENQWWEIKRSNYWGVDFARWNGLAWDILKNT